MLRVYNTLTRSLEKFIPIEEDRVSIYVCGPTVYDYTHIGHGRTYVAFDVIKRYFRLRGFDVFHVQNITDIDDKIISRANREGKDWKEIADVYSKDYLDALEKLNIKVDLHPRVTHHIREIVEFVKVLIDKGYAYVAPSGSVYFNVDMYEDYGKLSGRLSKEQWGQEGEYVKEKRNPYDFALWKAAKPGEPWWESPWGKGRPGWHIECSVMSSKYLGQQFDIHGGGTDLIFPHHENERAQSEAAFGKRPWVRYWLHTGMLNIGGEKMSKSFGNIVPLNELFKKYDPKVIRLWLTTAHYRRILNFTEESLEQAKANLERLINTIVTLKKLFKEVEPDPKLNDKDVKIIKELEKIRKGFYRSMDHDFNTSEAFSYIYEVTNLVFKDIEIMPSYTTVKKAYDLLKEFNEVLGVLDEELREIPVLTVDVNKVIQVVVDVRDRLRRQRMYELADWIREKLNTIGIMLMDGKEGTTWRIIRG